MQIPLLHQHILLATERLRDLHRTMMQHQHAVDAAEVEAFLHEIRNLYAVALEYQKLNSMQHLNELTAMNTSLPDAEASPVTSGVIPEPVKAPVTSRIEQIPEPVKMETNTSVNGKKKIITDVHEKFEEKHTIGAQFSDHGKLADKLAGHSGKRISDNLHDVPVKDLKVAIGLNEKFQFINHLFSGDAAVYNSTIQYLDTCEPGEAATAFLKKVASDHNWEQHATAAASFLDLVERRFISA